MPTRFWKTAYKFTINQASSLGLFEVHQMTVTAILHLILNRASAMESSRSAQPQRQASTSRVSKTSAPELAFVCVTHPDEIKNRNTQKKIHRDVMKDIGFARRRRPRRETIVLNLTSEEPASSNPESDKTFVPCQSDRPFRYTSNLHSQRSPVLALSQTYSSRIPTPHADRSFYSHIVSPRARRLLSLRTKPTCSV